MISADVFFLLLFSLQAVTALTSGWNRHSSRMTINSGRGTFPYLITASYLFHEQLLTPDSVLVSDFNTVQKFTERHQAKERSTNYDLTLPKCRLATGHAKGFCLPWSKNAVYICLILYLTEVISDTESLSGFKKRIFQHIFIS